MARRFRKPKKIIEAHAFQPKDLKAFTERLGRIDRDMAALRDDKKQILIEADAKGFHKKIILQAMAELRRAEKMKLKPGEKECLECYIDALSGTPLGNAAAAKAKSNHTPFQKTEKDHRSPRVPAETGAA